MSKKLYFLISFVLVLGLSSVAQADAIEVNNPSFEIAVDGVNTVPGHAGYDLIKDWSGNYPWGGDPPGDSPGFIGVDVQCPYADSAHCHRWPGSDGGVVFSYLQHAGTNAYQVLDLHNSDANGVIVAGRKYTLTYDALGWNGDQHAASLFYVEDVCYPDVNHKELASKTYALVYIERALEDCEGESDLDSEDECPDWNYDLTVTFVAETGADCIGKTLGIKLTALEPGDYSFFDNIRVDWSWSSSAYDPDPADEAKDVPIDVNLAWSPGLWAVSDVNGHEVYFGTSEIEVTNATTATTGIYRGSGVGVVTGPDVNNRYSYDGLETLDLGKTYYWRIDEVNEGWVSGPVPPVNDRWKGDVWSFEAEGKAKAVYPADLALDIPALNLILRWTAGTGAAGHDVYFGSDEAAVEDANTNTTGIYRGPTQALSDVNYPVEDLEVSESYYWRIDEVNTATVKGDVWSFTTGVFLIVDSFEPYRYVDTAAIRAVWKDVWTGTIPLNHAEIFLEFADANKFLDTGEQSMKFYYQNYERTMVGCTTEAALPLEVGTDWTIGGVKALVLNFCGDTANGQEPHASYTIANDRMWMSLLDGDSSEGIVRYPDMNHVTDGDWHQWNISLQDPCFSDVNVANVAKVYIGFGGPKGGAVSKYGAGYTAGGDTVWFDDISLYPPRCLPSVTGLDVLRGLGDIVGGGEEGAQDCNTDYLDLALMAQHWNMRGMWATAGLPVVGPIIEYKFDEGTGTTVVNTGSLTVPNPPDYNVPDYNLTIGTYVDGNGVFGTHPNHAPLWLDDPCRGWVLSFDGEVGMWPGFPPAKDEPALGGDYLIGPALNTASNTMSITAWIKPNPTFGKTEAEFKNGFTGIVTTRTHPTINPSVGSEADGLNFAGGGGFVYDGMLGYTWNSNAASTWNWNSDIFPVNLEWNFVAVVIEPGKATAYIGDPSKTLLTATNAIAHDADLLDARFMIAGDVGHDRFFKGLMDDIRIYDYSLSAGNILGLAEIPGIVYVPLTSVADIVEGDKEPTDPNAPIDDQVDFVDYAKLAENWLEQHPWP